MNRTTVNVIVDVVAFAAMLLLAATGALMKFILPPGSGHFSRIWGMDRHGWGDIHAWIAVVLLATVAIHLYLHWKWVVSVVAGRSPERAKRRVVVAAAACLGLLGLASAPFFAAVERGGEPPHKSRSAERPSAKTIDINGTMTLDEVEHSTGVPAAVILRELGLPASVPTDERLGRLRKRYDFDVHRVREIVEKQRKP
ncbi:MAG: DUF4405 domain-containing protein [Thermoguttaceae bacterium]